MQKSILLTMFVSGLAFAGSAISVDLLDKTRRTNAYDGFEITNSAQKIKVPMGKADWAFTLSDFEKNKFVLLKERLGDSAFEKIVKVQGYKMPKNEFETFTGTDGLPVYFYTRPDKHKNAVVVILVSYGEYQPSRYIAHIEGIWRVKGKTF